MGCDCDLKCDEVEELDGESYNEGYDDGFKAAVKWCVEGLGVMAGGYADGGKAIDNSIGAKERHPYQELLIFTAFRLEAAVRLAASQIVEKCPYPNLYEEDEA